MGFDLFVMVVGIPFFLYINKAIKDLSLFILKSFINFVYKFHI